MVTTSIRRSDKRDCLFRKITRLGFFCSVTRSTPSAFTHTCRIVFSTNDCVVDTDASLHIDFHAPVPLERFLKIVLHTWMYAVISWPLKSRTRAIFESLSSGFTRSLWLLHGYIHHAWKARSIRLAGSDLLSRRAAHYFFAVCRPASTG